MNIKMVLRQIPNSRVASETLDFDFFAVSPLSLAGTNKLAPSGSAYLQISRSAVAFYAGKIAHGALPSLPIICAGRRCG